MPFWFFLSDLSKMDQTWSNFLARNGFLAIMAWLLFRSKILLSNLKDFLARNVFFARNGFFKMNLPYLSKYWKTRLAFDGWKLSGLFNHNNGMQFLIKGEGRMCSSGFLSFDEISHFFFRFPNVSVYRMWLHNVN